MTGIFDDVSLGWKGKTYTIPAKKAMQAIAQIEEVITLQELTTYAARGTAPMGRLANAFAKVLNFAGCKVDPADVYEGMFAAGDSSESVMTSINTLLMMMIPPKVRRAIEAGGDVPKPVVAKGEKEPDPGNSPKTAKARSKPTTKSQSARGGASHLNSGH